MKNLKSNQFYTESEYNYYEKKVSTVMVKNKSPLISTKWTIMVSFQLNKVRKTTTYDVWIPGPGFGCAQTFDR
jgi:hypothetical protein